MQTQTIWQRLRQRPFTPFRIRLSGGNHHDIFHPEMLVVTKNSVIVTIHRKKRLPTESDLADDVAILSPLHITSVEDIPQLAKSRR